ncbi:MAG: threonine synthase [bacterium]|nr:threonine synthase [bacterium]
MAMIGTGREIRPNDRERAQDAGTDGEGTPPPAFRANLKCIECDAEYDLYQVIYRCRACDGLLTVAHDPRPIRAKGAQAWKDLFTSRTGDYRHPNGSGIWSRREWVLPEIQDEHIVSHGEGNTPLSHLPALASELGLSNLWIKQCGVSHTGSFKDLGMTVLVSHVKSLIARGVGIRAVACASSGDTSAALAAYAAAAGVPTIVFLPAGKISTAQLLQPLSSGAHVLSLDTDFDGCMRIVKDLTQNDDSIYLANSMNPLRIEGQKTVSIELCQQLGWELPDWVIIPGGNLGNVYALGQGFHLLKEAGIISKAPRICVAQAAAANPLYLSYQTGFREYKAVAAGETLASAIRIGDPVSYPRAVKTLREFDGIVRQASESELASAAARVDRHGMFNDPHTGVALACMFQMVEAGEIEAGQSAAVISTAHGLKFVEFKTAYHEARLDMSDFSHRNEPVPLPADAAAVGETLNRLLG